MSSPSATNSCSRSDTFGWHFKQCHNRDGLVKAPVILHCYRSPGLWSKHLKSKHYVVEHWIALNYSFFDVILLFR